ncbi:MAG: alpha/beta fold hydrolase [Wenzhouxiangellaceae bacterium]
MIIKNWRAQGGFEELGGLNCFVVERAGAGTPILWLHGFPSSSLDWHRVVEHLPGRRMLLPDFPGFGLSDKPIAGYSYSLIDQADRIIMLLVRRGITNIHLIAHDMGTSVACELLARRAMGLLPVEIASLVLTNGSVYIEQARLTPSQKLLRSPAAGLYARLASWRMFRWQIGRILGRPLPPGELEAMWHLMQANDGIRALPATIAYVSERYRYYRRWTEPLEDLNLPSLILWGGKDPVAVPAIGQRLADTIPGARLEWLEACGHFPMLEQPEEFAAIVHDFLDRQTEPCA